MNEKDVLDTLKEVVQQLQTLNRTVDEIGTLIGHAIQTQTKAPQLPRR
jgi:hypothetical protein